jgi:hypothetical protein
MFVRPNARKEMHENLNQSQAASGNASDVLAPLAPVLAESVVEAHANNESSQPFSGSTTQSVAGAGNVPNAKDEMRYRCFGTSRLGSRW